MSKIILLTIVFVVIAIAVGFYGGTRYQASKTPNFQNISSEQRQQMFQQMGANAAGVRAGRTGSRAGANLVNGEIIAKDDQSVTVKILDGGSKIIFFSESTEVSKFAEATPDDLIVGTQIMATGTQNDDGTLTAQSIQVRPQLQMPGAGDQPTN